MNKKLLTIGFVSMFIFISCPIFSQDFTNTPEEVLMELFQLTEEEALMVIIHIEEMKANKFYLEDESFMEDQKMLQKEMEEDVLGAGEDIIRKF
ncbi:MAG: hypothetical protein KAJ14_00900 [Candidatus Omnitrophica bacterium]|nr:hypothetical protein [Candidatus Omnitrophota bacterium]MCK5491651.1 hypothetical protein [Candidatus Omnitrophota bacterium]